MDGHGRIRMEIRKIKECNNKINLNFNGRTVTMTDEKKPFLTVDYSKTEMPEELKKLQEECEHKTISILDVAPEILFNKYGIAKKENIINYICENCGKMFYKVKK